MTSGVSQEVFDQAKSLIDLGDVDGLKKLIDKHPLLCGARNGDAEPPTFGNAVLLYATSWPGG